MLHVGYACNVCFTHIWCIHAVCESVLYPQQRIGLLTYLLQSTKHERLCHLIQIAFEKEIAGTALLYS